MLHTIDSVTARAAIAALARWSLVAAFIFFLPFLWFRFRLGGSVAMRPARAVRKCFPAANFTMPELETAKVNGRRLLSSRCRLLDSLSIRHAAARLWRHDCHRKEKSHARQHH